MSSIPLFQNLAASRSYQSSVATANPFAVKGPTFGNIASASPFGDVSGNLLAPKHTGGASGLGDQLCITA